MNSRIEFLRWGNAVGALGFLLLMNLVVCSVYGQGASINVGDAVDASAVEAEIEESLSNEVAFRFEETPLEDIVESLNDELGFSVVLDRRSLEDVGLDGAVPITIQVEKMSLRSALNLILNDLELTWMIRNESLVISTIEAIEHQMQVRFYDVSDLVDIPRFSEYYTPKRAGDADQLMHVLVATVEPDSWAEVGGPGNIQSLVMGNATLLVIDQTSDVHFRLREMMGKLRIVLQDAEAQHAARVSQQREEGNDGNDIGANDRATVGEGDPNQPTGDADLTVRIFPVAEEKRDQAEEYVELVQVVIDKANWVSRDDVYVKAIASTIVVKHKPEVIEAVSQLLTDAGAFQVSTPNVMGLQGGEATTDFNGAGGFFSIQPKIRYDSSHGR